MECIAAAMLSVRATLKTVYDKLHKMVLAIVRDDAVCRWLMTVPSVGMLVAKRGRQAVVIGDLMHPTLQSREPDWSTIFDWDPA